MPQPAYTVLYLLDYAAMARCLAGSGLALTP